MDGMDYKPAAGVLDRLKTVEFVAVVGPTGSGKTTLMKKAMETHPELSMVMNNTSRAPRPGERESIDYFFKTRAEMEARIKRGEFVQVAPAVLGEWYATAPEDYATDGVCMLAVIARAVPVFRALPFKAMRTVFIVPPGWEAWHERLKRHGFTPEQFAKRSAEARESLEFALTDEDSPLIINEDLDMAAEDFAMVALGKPLPERLKTGQPRARALASDLLARLT